MGLFCFYDVFPRHSVYVSIPPYLGVELGVKAHSLELIPPKSPLRGVGTHWRMAGMKLKAVQVKEAKAGEKPYKLADGNRIRRPQNRTPTVRSLNI